MKGIRLGLCACFVGLAIIFDGTSAVMHWAADVTAPDQIAK